MFMTSPALAHQTDFGRMYARKIGGLPQVPSITNVIGQEKMDLDGWIGHMAATAVVQDPRLGEAVGNSAKLKALARQSSKAAADYRDAAAARGDRVHQYCEQIALRAMGKPHQAAAAREALASNNEEGFAGRFDEWWDTYQVQPLAAEVTVWNESIGYAGTLDLVATIAGRLWLPEPRPKKWWLTRPLAPGNRGNTHKTRCCWVWPSVKPRSRPSWRIPTCCPHIGRSFGRCVRYGAPPLRSGKQGLLCVRSALHRH
jgi:hypothetical protein